MQIVVNTRHDHQTVYFDTIQSVFTKPNCYWGLIFSRVAALGPEFTGAFSAADELIVTEVHAISLASL